MFFYNNKIQNLLELKMGAWINMGEMNLIKYYFNGGFLMHPIFLLMVVSTAWSIKQYLNLTYNFTLNEKFFTKIKMLVKEGRVHEAYQHCLSTSHPVSKIFAAILYDSNRNKNIIESALKIEAQKVLSQLQGSTHTIYQSAKMVLLLGAMGLFHAMALTLSSVSSLTANVKVDIVEQFNFIAQGISSGMYVSVFSLFVAFQCMAFHSYLNHKEKRIYNRYQEVISEIAHLVIFKQYTEIVNERSQGNEYRRYGT